MSKGLFTKFCQDKLYELDKSWENNLVIYGINQMKEEEERPSLMESRVREILRYFVADSYWQMLSDKTVITMSSITTSTRTDPGLTSV